MSRKIIITFAVLCIALIVVGFNYKRLPGKVVSAVDYTRCKLISMVNKPDYEASNNSKPSDDFHLRCVKPEITLDDIVQSKNINKNNDFNVFIDLAKRTLYFKYKDEVLKEYVIAAGSKTSVGVKQKEGDCKTPIGEFFICEKKEYYPSKKYLGSRWMMLSYPNVEAAEYGLTSKMISREVYNEIKDAISDKSTPPQNTKLGSYVGIHGGARPSYPRDWTAGCVGMYDRDVEEIYKYLKVGSKVTIK